jgi:predicted nucleotidyltransferase
MNGVYSLEKELLSQRKNTFSMRPSPSSSLFQPLDYVLASPALIRVTRVLAAHGSNLGISDVSRRAKLTLPSVRAAVRRLLDADIVEAVGVGRSMVCQLRPAHPLFQPIVNLFAAEREQADAVVTAIRTAAATLEPAPLAVWLYGSVARGKDQPTSDVDVAIVSGENQPSAQADALREGLTVALSGRADRVSVIALGPGDVRRLSQGRTKLWRELERDAVVLMGEAPAGVLESVAAA